MKTCTRLARLATTTALALALGACDEGTPIAGTQPPTVTMTDPEAGLPPGEVQLTNSSAGTSVPGIAVNAGTKNFIAGSIIATGLGRTTLMSKFVFDAIGSVNTTDVQGLRLWNGKEPLCHSDPIIENNQAIIDLKDCPIQLSPGQTANLFLKTNIVSGVNRYKQFSLAKASAVSVHDLANHEVPATLNTGSWPMNLSYLTIGPGSFSFDQAQPYPARLSSGNPSRQVMASFRGMPLGEAVRVNGFILKIFLTNGLVPQKLEQIEVWDTVIGKLVSVPPLTTNDTQVDSGLLYYILPHNGPHGDLIVTTNVADGASGTVQICLSAITAQGFTSLANLAVPDICGPPVPTA